MKIKIKVLQEVNIKTLKVIAKVRYWEDSIINGVEDTEGNLTPCRNGENWEPLIDIDSGRITNWKQGVVADVHFKVCDCGIYELLDDRGITVIKRDGYVPKIMSPGGSGYGDYIIMKIDENGVIENWDPSFDDFESEED